MKKYRLTKVSDDKFKGNHPNMIFAGLIWEGGITKKPEVGERFHFGSKEDHPRDHLYTSTVTEIVSDTIFKTNNSTYKLKEIPNDKNK